MKNPLLIYCALDNLELFVQSYHVKAYSTSPTEIFFLRLLSQDIPTEVLSIDWRYVWIYRRLDWISSTDLRYKPVNTDKKTNQKQFCNLIQIVGDAALLTIEDFKGIGFGSDLRHWFVVYHILYLPHSYNLFCSDAASLQIPHSELVSIPCLADIDACVDGFTIQFWLLKQECDMSQVRRVCKFFNILYKNCFEISNRYMHTKCVWHM